MEVNQKAGYLIGGQDPPPVPHLPQRRTKRKKRKMLIKCNHLDSYIKKWHQPEQSGKCRERQTGFLLA